MIWQAAGTRQGPTITSLHCVYIWPLARDRLLCANTCLRALTRIKQVSWKTKKRPIWQLRAHRKDCSLAHNRDESLCKTCSTRVCATRATLRVFPDRGQERQPNSGGMRAVQIQLKPSVFEVDNLQVLHTRSLSHLVCVVILHMLMWRNLGAGYFLCLGKNFGCCLTIKCGCVLKLVCRA